MLNEHRLLLLVVVVTDGSMYLETQPSEKEEVIMAILHFHQLPRRFFLGLQFQLAFFGGLGARKFLFGACFASTKEQLHGF